MSALFFYYSFLNWNWRLKLIDTLFLSYIFGENKLFKLTVWFDIEFCALDWVRIDWDEVAPVDAGIEEVNDAKEDPFIPELLLPLFVVALVVLEAAFVVAFVTFTIWLVNENIGDCIKFWWDETEEEGDSESTFLISSSIFSIL